MKRVVQLELLNEKSCAARLQCLVCLTAQLLFFADPNFTIVFTAYYFIISSCFLYELAFLGTTIAGPLHILGKKSPCTIVLLPLSLVGLLLLPFLLFFKILCAAAIFESAHSKGHPITALGVLFSAVIAYRKER